MKTKWFPKIAIDSKHIPYKWQERLVEQGKVGGVMLVFIEGMSRIEVENKAKVLRNFCNDLRNKEGIK